MRDINNLFAILRVPHIFDNMGVFPKSGLVSSRTHLPSKLVAGWLVAAIKYSLDAHSHSAKPIVGESRLPALLRLKFWIRARYHIATQAMLDSNLASSLLCENTSELRGDPAQRYIYAASCRHRDPGVVRPHQVLTCMPWVTTMCVPVCLNTPD